MKKFFLFFAAMLVALTVSAATTNIQPGSSTLIGALSTANDGDIIVLADGIYNESSDYIVFNKNVEVKAADGANPVVKVAHYIKVEGSKDVTIRGIVFDGSVQGDRNQFVRIYAAKSLTLDGCSFTGVKKSVFLCESTSSIQLLSVNNSKFSRIYSKVVNNEGTIGKVEIDGCEFDSIYDMNIYSSTAAHMDSCVINNSYFHDCVQSATYFPKTGSSKPNACDVLLISNSTFANFSGFDQAVVAFYNHNETTNEPQNEDAEMKVTSCTFYNLLKSNANSTYAFVDSRKSGNVVIDKCIFANPNSNQCFSNYCYGSSAIMKNSIYFNTKGTKCPTENCATSNPNFQDAANGDYTLSYGSPALNYTIGEDKANLGDPRWVPNFYVTGSAVGGWTAHEKAAVKSYTIKDLAAGSYQMKITRNGTWDGENNVYGYDALSAKIGGLYRGTGDDNDNICFTLAEAGDVTVTYIHGEKYTVEGNFVLPTIELAGSMTEWAEHKVAFTPAEDKLTASTTIHLDDSYYEFKMIVNGAWLSKAGNEGLYTLHRGWTSVSDLVDITDNIVLTPDLEGDYTFTWTYATGSLTVTFPEIPNVTVYFVNEPKWENVYAYGFDPMIVAWPGELASKTEVKYGELEVWSYTMPINRAHIVFNDGTGGEGHQTADLDLEDGKPYYYAGTWYAELPKTPTAIDNTVDSKKAVKMIENGQIVILKNGVRYNVLGAQIK